MNNAKFASRTVMLTPRTRLFSTLLVASVVSSCIDDGGTGTSVTDAGQDVADIGDVSPDSDAADAGSDADADVALALVDHESWQPLDESSDPFDDRPDEIDCDPEAFGMELIDPEETFFVKTQGCEYVTVTQPLAAAIERGDVVNIRAWHYDLTAPAASEAHLALRIGEHLVWEEYVPIPSGGALMMDTWTSPEDIAVGEDIFFHVHNHGDNEYNLIEVSLPQ